MFLLILYFGTSWSVSYVMKPSPVKRNKYYLATMNFTKNASIIGYHIVSQPRHVHVAEQTYINMI